ncbi:hypothetical protein PFICI_08373 [Pestalotiopsis fici W106-1]|uniref:Uncharacterized protein n=1 Tax=Pestalotiopsis fici (strain W106-1 / CGMCC3.15140) TaxID=1229662 RepID=W3X4B2_PESFW|nr:uncharacterized protein PFICI_08373 [Pestalotiopsis fici W106-1]ETS80844.1 hypothetical protein PFICI_08373 [Pestalotiopsis fici W106-1]
MILSKEAAVTAAGTAYNAILASIQSEAASLESSIVSAESVAYASLIGNATGIAATTTAASTTATAADGTSTGESAVTIYGTDSSGAGALPTAVAGLQAIAGGIAMLAAVM